MTSSPNVRNRQQVDNDLLRGLSAITWIADIAASQDFRYKNRPLILNGIFSAERTCEMSALIGSFLTAPPARSFDWRLIQKSSPASFSPLTQILIFGRKLLRP